MTEYPGWVKLAHNRNLFIAVFQNVDYKTSSFLLFPSFFKPKSLYSILMKTAISEKFYFRSSLYVGGLITRTLLFLS